MAWTSLREHIEEMAHLNRLVGTGLGALARSEATNAELERREQIVGGLVKRCKWVEATLEDMRKSDSETGPDAGKHFYFLRSSLEQANDRIADLTAELSALRVRLKVKPKKSYIEKKRARKEKKKKKKEVRRAAAATPKREPVRSPTIDEKLRSHQFETKPVGNAQQSFRSGRRRGLVVEKVVRRTGKGRK